ncbi:hypothetical protein NDU88_001814 [Pleurodeles waltl]|uniref:Retrotransposon gag domain-containing protein n=1 Tax=Pleurodeles waltl TaxID=8319 RepID=A0AAV7W2M8_PLEWA|nr:hypothetical protein NDU88_001814 [Pleurodeles waltl]
MKRPARFRDDEVSTVASKRQAAGKNSSGPVLYADLEELLMRAREILARQGRSQEKEETQGSAEGGKSGAKRAMEGIASTLRRAQAKDSGTSRTVRQAGLDLTAQDKKEEDRRDKRRPRVERSIENWLKAFRTLACVFAEKFTEIAAELFPPEQSVHAAQLKYQGNAWLHYDEWFREKMQTWPAIEWDQQDVEGLTNHMVDAREGMNDHKHSFCASGLK